MDTHQGLEDLTVIGHAEMQQFVCNDEILKADLLIGQILRKG